MEINIRKGTYEEAEVIHRQIEEFEKEYLSNKLPDIDTESMVIFIVSLNGKDVGYSISYDRWQDGSLYAWMAGVIKKYRGQGCYQALAKARYNYAIENGYTSLRLKTKNRRREMLGFLIKDGWNVIDFDKEDDPLNNNILFEKIL
jgi:predicted GNAT superfamily acetyltransferase